MRKVETMICFNSRIDKNFQADKLYYMKTREKHKGSVFWNIKMNYRSYGQHCSVCVCVFVRERVRDCHIRHVW